MAATLLAGCGKKGAGGKSSGRELPADALVFDEAAGLTYKVGEITPYTGKALWYYVSSQIEQETSYVDGKEHGTEIWWHESGARAGQSEYKNGILAGPTRYIEVRSIYHWGHRNNVPVNGGKATGIKDLIDDGSTHFCWESVGMKEKKSGFRHNQSFWSIRFS